MNKLIAKTAVACAVAAASLFAASAHATVFPDFTVDPANSVKPNFVADRIAGSYVEVATFVPLTPTTGTFNVSLLWNAGQFGVNDGAGTLTAFKTGLTSTYQLYATYKGSGNFSSVGGKTVFNFTPGSGTLQMFLDSQMDTDLETGIHNPVTGAGNFTIDGSADDSVIANGIPQFGQGTLDPSLSTCGSGGGSGINCGSFGSTTTFQLTAAGKLFFVAPNPFYNLSFESGNLNNFQPTGTQTVNGTANVVFGSAVPEPGSIALLGLGLLGLCVARGRKQS